MDLACHCIGFGCQHFSQRSVENNRRQESSTAVASSWAAARSKPKDNPRNVRLLRSRNEPTTRTTRTNRIPRGGTAMVTNLERFIFFKWGISRFFTCFVLFTVVASWVAILSLPSSESSHKTKQVELSKRSPIKLLAGSTTTGGWTLEKTINMNNDNDSTAGGVFWGATVLVVGDCGVGMASFLVAYQRIARSLVVRCQEWPRAFV